MTQNNDTYNKGGLIAFIFSMAFSLLFFVWVAIIYPGIDLREVPDTVSAEGELADAEGGQAVDIKQVENPWVSSEALIAHGQGLYKTACVVCHGAEGKGDGPGASGIVPPPRNLVAGEWTQGGDAMALYSTITKGIPGTSMMGFAHLSKVDRWALVHYVQSITNNRVDADPAALEAFAKSAE